MSVDITPGAVARMLQQGNTDFHPVLQVLQLKKMPSQDGSERYRVVLSDAQHFCQGLLASQLNHLVSQGQLKQHQLVRVNHCMINTVPNGASSSTQIVIVLGLDILTAQPVAKIGNPTALDLSSASASTTTAPLNNATNSLGADGNAGQKRSNPYSSGTSPPRRSSPGNPYAAASSSSTSPRGAPIVRSTAAANSLYTPIAQLNMYAQRWTICARLTSKSDVRTWSNARGEGSLFSVELLDGSGDIRATFFKEGVDRFYATLQVGKVYSWAGGRVKVANAQYNTCSSNFELTFDQNSEIHLQEDGAAGLPAAHAQWSLVKIATLEGTEAGANVDVLGAVSSVGESRTFTSKKSGKDVTKCEVTVVDDSGASVAVTLWGDAAVSAPSKFSPSVPGETPRLAAFRRARVTEFNGGKSLSGPQTVVQDAADLPPDAVAALSSWWMQQGGTAATAAKSLSAQAGGGGTVDPFDRRKPIAAIADEQLGKTNPDKPDWITFKAQVSFLKSDKDGGAWYPACPNAGDPCKNMYKVTQNNEGAWYCEKCQGTYQNCIRRWIFSGTVMDDTSSTWVSFFNEQAQVLLNGATADEMYDKSFGSADGSTDAYESAFEAAKHTEWIFKCKVKQELYEDEARVKSSVYALQPVNYLQESKDMLRFLQAV